MKKTIHVFDVDGTIIQGDSLLQILLFSTKNFFRIGLYLISTLPQVITGNNGLAKQKILRRIFKAKSKMEIDAMGNVFFEDVLKYRLRPRAVARIIELNESNIPCVLLSASCDAWLKPLATYLSADLICTQMEYGDNSNFTGHFASPNCKGPEKIRRLLAKYPASEYVFVCYGNSRSDKILQSVCQQFYYRYF